MRPDHTVKHPACLTGSFRIIYERETRTSFAVEQQAAEDYAGAMDIAEAVAIANPGKSVLVVEVVEHISAVKQKPLVSRIIPMPAHEPEVSKPRKRR